MIGDAAKILSAVRNCQNLKRAFHYAYRDRLNDRYYDHFELEAVVRNKGNIIARLTEELKSPENYAPQPAYAYFIPKNELCYRRMIYIPFKDLVVRYALVTVFADLLDADLSPSCFANRRSKGKEREARFLENFASISWPNFCKWQNECKEQSKFNTLLRTDISSFYDSISHEYLIKTIADQLNILTTTEVMVLLRKLLQIPVIAYSHLTGKTTDPEIMHQGLATGNNTEGFLANLYLKSVDEAMNSLEGIAFGRYVDDMRIFATRRQEAKRAMLILQEYLLARGLNLNGSKTKIVEGKQKIEELRSKAYSPYDCLIEEEDSIEQNHLPITDRPFDEFNRYFEPGQALETEEDTKDFCRFLSTALPASKRHPAYIDMLKTILWQWHSSTKHASWCLVETIVNSECPQDTREYAAQALLDCLSDVRTSVYGKYRLLHYLVGRHKDSQILRINYLSSSAIDLIKGLLPQFLEEQAFELNIMALYMMRVLGATHADLEAAVEAKFSQFVPVPINNILTSVAKGIPFISDYNWYEEDKFAGSYY